MGGDRSKGRLSAPGSTPCCNVTTPSSRVMALLYSPHRRFIFGYIQVQPGKSNFSIYRVFISLFTVIFLEYAVEMGTNKKNVKSVIIFQS